MKIIVLCGKSASGKDTIQTELVKRGYEKLISTTTRPMRPGEVEGREYFFRLPEVFASYIANDRLIEYRIYETLVDGKPDRWCYGLEKRELDEAKDYVTIMDLKGLEALKNYYGKENILPIYLKATDELRKNRCIDRGDYNKTEWNRRLKADRIDFSKENLDKSDVWTIRIDDTRTPERITDMIEGNLYFFNQLYSNDDLELD